MTLRTLNYGNYGIFLLPGLISSTVAPREDSNRGLDHLETSTADITLGRTPLAYEPVLVSEFKLQGVGARVFICIYIYICMYACMFIYLNVCSVVYANICVYIHT